MSFQVIQNELWWYLLALPPPNKKRGRDLRTIKFSLYWKNKRATEFSALEKETAIVFAQKSWEAKENQSESRLNKNNQNERS